MDVRGIEVAQRFWSKHRDAEAALLRWMELVRRAQWAAFTDCRKTFGSADQVRTAIGVVTVFNIRGNNYRLVAVVSYALGIVTVRRVMTHAEYSRDDWKD